MSWARMTLAVGLVALTSLVAASTSAAQTPGSPGVGDPYFPLAGNGGYEVDHYDLNLVYAPGKGRLLGGATIEATATQALSAFNLDLLGLHVRSVTVNGMPAGFAQAGGELRTTPTAAIADGKRFEISVTYSGRPRSIRAGQPFGAGWTRTNDGGFALDEPVGSATWFPCNDHPSDKASYRITVTVPRHRAAISNGSLLSVSGSHGARTFVWDEPEPMTTYLATVAIGRFKVHRSVAAGVPSLVAVDPGAKRLGKGTSRSLSRIPRILGTFGSIFGPYPFATTGAIIDNDPKFSFAALETQTRPLFPRPFPSFYFTGVLAHELAHEWFGDAVSIERWSDIWLNEGFATWAEWFWGAGGSDESLREVFRVYYNAPAKARKRFGLDRLWGPVVSPPPKDLFGTAVYFRGGMTLEALRELVGDATFFSILRDWVAQHRYGNATTEQFIALAEAKSGRSLSRFFDVWLRQVGRPTSWS